MSCRQQSTPRLLQFPQPSLRLSQLELLEVSVSLDDLHLRDVSTQPNIARPIGASRANTTPTARKETNTGSKLKDFEQKRKLMILVCVGGNKLYLENDVGQGESILHRIIRQLFKSKALICICCLGNCENWLAQGVLFWLKEGEEAGDVAEDEETVAETERLQFVEFAARHRSKHQGGQHVVGRSVPLAAAAGHLRVTVVSHLQTRNMAIWQTSLVLWAS